jgi:hypothetical protein
MMLDKLRSASARGHRGRLAVVGRWEPETNDHTPDGNAAGYARDPLVLRRTRGA